MPVGIAERKDTGQGVPCAKEHANLRGLRRTAFQDSSDDEEEDSEEDSDDDDAPGGQDGPGGHDGGDSDHGGDDGGDEADAPASKRHRGAGSSAGPSSGV